MIDIVDNINPTTIIETSIILFLFNIHTSFHPHVLLYHIQGVENMNNKRWLRWLLLLFNDQNESIQSHILILNNKMHESYYMYHEIKTRIH